MNEKAPIPLNSESEEELGSVQQAFWREENQRTTVYIQGKWAQSSMF